MIRNATFIIACASAALSGCASSPSLATSAVSGLPAIDGEIILGALPEAGVPAGECGMMLWTLDENRPTAIFRYVAGKTADIVVDGRPILLTRTDAGGASAFGVFARQSFTNGSGLMVNVDVQFSVGFDGGTYLERGLVVVESPDGWRTVAPSAGLAGCRAR